MGGNTSKESGSKWAQFETAMKAEKLSPAAIAAFKMNYDKLIKGEDGIIPETEIAPASDIKSFVDDVQGKMEIGEMEKLLEQTVIIKLNGGLGTSMGLSKAKSLLPVKEGKTFLDLISEQQTKIKGVTFLLMNSFSTSKDSMEALKSNKDIGEFVQNKSPKIVQETLEPADFKKNPSLNFCPPGHGDIYAALLGSGKLDELIKAGKKYVFISNSDNLGATLDLELLKYFADSKAPFMMEVCKRTENDKKGGHLCKRKSDGQLLLRESAMCAKEDEKDFQNIEKHQFFNTNNLWLDLTEVKKVMSQNKDTMPLPLIMNSKTVDPRDATTTKVYQLETAMGSAIISFKGSQAICVPRSRFAPVKKCNDLFMIRSDAYEISKDSTVVLNPKRKVAPIVSLDSKKYKLVDQLEELIPSPPSMVECDRLEVKGAVKFEKGIKFVGAVKIVNDSDTVKTLKAKTYKDQDITL